MQFDPPLARDSEGDTILEDARVREILEVNKPQTYAQLKAIGKQRLKQQRSIPWTIQGLFNHKFKSKWEKRLQIYHEKTTILLESEDAARTIYQLFKEEFQALDMTGYHRVLSNVEEI